MDEMRVWDGVKKRSKNMGWSCGKNREMTSWQREQVPRKWRENGGDEERNSDGRFR